MSKSLKYIGASAEVSVGPYVFERNLETDVPNGLYAKLVKNPYFADGADTEKVAPSDKKEKTYGTTANDAPTVESMMDSEIAALEAGVSDGVEAPVTDKTEDATQAVTIPDDWATAHHSTRIKLANDLGYDVTSAEDANTAIELHLAQNA